MFRLNVQRCVRGPLSVLEADASNPDAISRVCIIPTANGRTNEVQLLYSETVEHCVLIYLTPAA